MTWRVIIEFGYSEIHFDFATATEASDFAITAVEHISSGDDNRKGISVRLCIVREEKEAEA